MKNYAAHGESRCENGQKQEDSCVGQPLYKMCASERQETYIQGMQETISIVCLKKEHTDGKFHKNDNILSQIKFGRRSGKPNQLTNLRLHACTNSDTNHLWAGKDVWYGVVEFVTQTPQPLTLGLWENLPPHTLLPP